MILFLISILSKRIRFPKKNNEALSIKTDFDHLNWENIEGFSKILDLFMKDYPEWLTKSKEMLPLMWHGENDVFYERKKNSYIVFILAALLNYKPQRYDFFIYKALVEGPLDEYEVSPYYPNYIPELILKELNNKSREIGQINSKRLIIKMNFSTKSI